jgi:hypothetical protein
MMLAVAPTSKGARHALSAMSVGGEPGDPRVWYLKLIEGVAQGPAYPLVAGEPGVGAKAVAVMLWLVWAVTLMFPLLAVALPVAAVGWVVERVR